MIKKRSVIVIGLIIIGLIVVGNLNRLIKFGLNSTIETEATVVDITFNPLIGHSWSEKYWYQFEVDGQFYMDTVYVEQNEILREPGEKIKVKYQENNPSINEVIE